MVDYSHPAYEDHIKTVEETLTEIGVSGKPIITVFNKIDQVEEEQTRDIKHTGGAHVFISAKNKKNLQGLRKLVYEEVSAKHMTIFPNYLKREFY